MRKRNKTHEPSPSGTLDTSSGSVEFLNEGVKATPNFLDGLLERTVLEGTTVALVGSGRGGKVLPEKRVVDVACAELMNE